MVEESKKTMLTLIINQDKLGLTLRYPRQCCQLSRHNFFSPSKFIFLRKNVDKILKEQKNSRRHQIRVQESIMHEKCISTIHICCNQREPFSQVFEYEC